MSAPARARLASAGLAALLVLAAAPLGAQTARRAMRVDDFARLRDVRDPQLSPDGKWVAYTVGAIDLAKDKNDSDVWMASWDGKENVRLTSSPESESSPRWSPDGRYLAFRSGREDSDGSQVWLLDRRGGEAVRLTSLKGGVDGFAWAPDGKRLVLEATDADSTPAKGDSAKAPKPIVLDRYHFKNDESGYLGVKRSHLYLFDVEAKKVDTLTAGAYEESQPSWSPDGRFIAFVSNRSAPDPDRTTNTDIWVVEARAGATPRKVTTYDGPDDGPVAWSPDGKFLAFLQGSETKYSAYNQDRLAVIPVQGGEARIVTASLDRGVASPRWAKDGWIYVLVTDDRARWLGRVRPAGGAVEHLTVGKRVVGALTQASDGRIAVTAATATQPMEVQALEKGALRPLSHQNDAWLAELKLGSTEDLSYTTKDGNEVHGLMVKPADYEAGRKYPTLLRIHGGPNGQDQYALSVERELFAANGYVVVSVNYRGSAGRGQEWSRSIFADWGHKEVVDLLGAMDAVVAMGVADPQRLGIGGWSYGCILTDYTMATDTRFKAATCGAGSAMQIAMYGVDEYVVQYDNELGPPWKSQDLWVKLSYPFFHADRIKTPTLFLGGDKDFNVPLVGGEQMYQALRTLGVPTQLVIYPGQHHGISRPSFQKDRFERYLAWYAKYVKPAAASTQQ